MISEREIRFETHRRPLAQLDYHHSRGSRKRRQRVALPIYGHLRRRPIDENLMRQELSTAERAERTARRKVLYEALHPETALGANNQHTAALRQNGEEQRARFAKATAEATGQSERAVQRDAQRGEELADVISRINGTSLDAVEGGNKTLAIRGRGIRSDAACARFAPNDAVISMPDDFDADEFFDLTGIDVRLAKPEPDPPLSSVGAAAQTELLQKLGLVRATLDIMNAIVRDHPESDSGFDALDASLVQQLAEASKALVRFRERRDCKGAA